jgi:hypothetical protein
MSVNPATTVPVLPEEILWQIAEEAFADIFNNPCALRRHVVRRLQQMELMDITSDYKRTGQYNYINLIHDAKNVRRTAGMNEEETEYYGRLLESAAGERCKPQN